MGLVWAGKLRLGLVGGADGGEEVEWEPWDSRASTSVCVRTDFKGLVSGFSDEKLGLGVFMDKWRLEKMMD